MNQREKIICPFCKVEMSEDIYEFTDSGDMDGFFHLDCDNCDEKFEVSFIFKPFIKEYRL